MEWRATERTDNRVRPTEHPSDEALIAAARKGSEYAFAVLVERYHGGLLRYLVRQTGDPELAADLVQETLLDVYRALDDLPDDRPFAAWLYRVARNNLLPAFRRRRRQRLLSLDRLIDHVGDVFPSLRPRDQSTAIHQRDLIQRVLDEMSPALREVLLLHDVAGFRGPEIAHQLRISPAAAEKRISRAKDRFRLLYQEFNGDDQDASL